MTFRLSCRVSSFPTKLDTILVFVQMRVSFVRSGFFFHPLSCTMTVSILLFLGSVTEADKKDGNVIIMGGGMGGGGGGGHGGGGGGGGMPLILISE